jgi:phosphoribosylanthranilate isomerase
MPPRLKICGLRHRDQALAIAARGASAIGVIGVPSSPRYLEPARRIDLFNALAEAFPACRRVLVVADPEAPVAAELERRGGHDVLQLHGGESPRRCAELRASLGLEIWKALRIRTPDDLRRAEEYTGSVDALLLDAWTEDQLGGTGQRLPIAWLEGFTATVPWWLAGGVTPEAVPEILRRVKPDGLDVSSGVENAPGDKNLERVRALVASLGISGSTGTPAA